MKSIDITCEYTNLIGIDDLKNFQGDLKTIEPEEMEKLKKSIMKYGFSFPVFVWNGNILDGHQRVKAARALLKDGYETEGKKLPVVEINAKDRREAAEKLLLINSRYAKIDQSGFDTFIKDFEIDIEDMSSLLEISDIEISIEEVKSNEDNDSIVNDINPNFEDAAYEINHLDTYIVNKKHVFICCNLTNDWSYWKDFLKDENDLFCPYASFYIFFSESAATNRLIVLQPDTYLFSKMLETLIDINGEDYIKKI